MLVIFTGVSPYFSPVHLALSLPGPAISVFTANSTGLPDTVNLGSPHSTLSGSTILIMNGVLTGFFAQ